MSSEGEGYMLGIDEAGRGPVLGPMVYGTCFCPVAREKELVKMGFFDSKVLKPEQRDLLYDKILASDFVGHFVDVIRPDELSAKMLRRSKYNLNTISFDSAIGLINKVIKSGKRVDKIFVDTVGDPGKYTAKLQGLFPNAEVVVKAKADSLFPIVSAASICAKVVRDRELEKWVFQEEKGGKPVSRELGSGYPGDPSTKAWLKSNFDPVFGFPSLVRFSWSTCTKLIDDRGHAAVWDDDEEEDQQDLESMLGTGTGPKRHAFFRDRKLDVVTSFRV